MDLILQYINLEQIKDKTVICFGCFQKAKDFAVRLLGNDIYFDYFLFPYYGNYYFPSLMNKQVIGIEALKIMNNYVVIASCNEFESAYQVLKMAGAEQNLVEVERIQPALKKSSNVIMYGQGARAERILNDFDKHLEVHGFCNSNKDKTGVFFHNKPVMHVSSLSKCPEDTCIIIGSTYYNEIKEKLLQYGIKEKQIFYMEYDKLFIFIDDEHQYLYRQKFLFNLLRDCKGKKVVLYGEKNTIKILSKIFLHLEIEVCNCLERDSFEEDGTIYSLAYYDMQDKVCIIADYYSEFVHDALENMNLKVEQYAWISNYDSYNVTGTERICHYVLDPNMGFSRTGKSEEYTSFIKYEYKGSESKYPVVILTLGGSTTSAYAVRQKSWSEFLSEKLSKDNINHIIYCGGINDYIASQELMKLIRDGLYLKPDYVLSYSGMNNMYINSDTPFVHDYQKKFYDRAISFDNSSIMQGVNYGVTSKCSNYEYWFMQMKIMHAICDDFQINFKAFLQPVLYSKNFVNETDKDLDISLLDGFLFDVSNNNLLSFDASDVFKKFHKKALHFRKKAKNVSEPWFYDFSGIFDEYNGVYMDLCHVYEKGNQVIAKKIYEILQEDL